MRQVIRRLGFVAVISSCVATCGTSSKTPSATVRAVHGHCVLHDLTDAHEHSTQVPASLGINLDFGKHNEVSGTNGCNAFSGRAQRPISDQIAVQFALTDKLCGPKHGAPAAAEARRNEPHAGNSGQGACGAPFVFLVPQWASGSIPRLMTRAFAVVE